MKKTIVLDLDETLVHTFGETDTLKKIKLLTDPRHIELRRECFILDFYDAREGKQYHLWGIKRPYLDEFLENCFNLFDIVIVWTAGSTDYADAIVNNIFKKPPHLIFSREHCRQFKNYIIKPLKDLFDYEPKLEKLTSIKHMIMIDDYEENFLLNKSNGIIIKPYLPRLVHNTIETDDNVLDIIPQYLFNFIKKYKDIGIGTHANLLDFSSI